MSTPASASAQSYSASTTVDIGVVIDRVRVVTSAYAYSSVTAYESVAASPSTAHAGDCRIRIRELLIETPSDTDFVVAYQLGREVARELADGLLSIQEKRLQTLLHSRNGMGPIVIQSLRARRLNPEGDNPPPHVICRELIQAVEGRLPQ